MGTAFGIFVITSSISLTTFTLSQARPAGVYLKWGTARVHVVQVFHVNRENDHVIPALFQPVDQQDQGGNGTVRPALLPLCRDRYHHG